MVRELLFRTLIVYGAGVILIFLCNLARYIRSVYYEVIYKKNLDAHTMLRNAGIRPGVL